MYSVNGSSNGNPPERCPYPLYSWDSTQEGHTIPHHHQGGNLRNNIVVKEEYKEEDEEYGVMEEFSEGPPNARKPLERCPSPLYSRDSTQEDHIIPHHHQSGNLRDSKADIKEEIKEENDEDGVMEKSESLKVHKDLYQDTMVESSSYRNPPERCPRPLYSRNSTQEGHIIPHHHQSENLMDDNAVVKEEFKKEDEVSPPGRCSLYSGDSTQESPTKPHHHQSGSLRDYNIVVKEEYTDEDDEYGMFGELSEGRKGHYKNIMMKSPPTEISTGSAIKKPSKEHPTLWKMEDEDITQDCAVEKKISSTMDGGAHSVDRPSNPSDSDLARTVGDADKIQEQKKFSCSECGELFSSDLILSIYRSFHEGDKLHFCSECGKGFVCKSELVEHSKSHTGEKPFAKHVAERSSDLYNGRSTLNGNR
ncbi:hypothetical protein AB205_0221110 [Aquarana catesbeiana]|uniref:C2H2-type domain-containing protein n=1 Tax=Aquarana catesbeiana TaxID=8400 RepID=A0A2G9RHH3_AQUCT|nr:hypothetical protein AB205_0221110 [Aquarana catesbeiana]